MITKAVSTRHKPPKPKAIQIPVSYGSITIVGKEVNIPLKILRADLQLEQADQHLCGRRLTGSILARPEGAAATQPGMFGDDGDLIVRGCFESARFGAKPKEFSATLAVALDQIDIEKLSHFAGREGLLTVDAVANLDGTPVEEFANAS